MPISPSAKKSLRKSVKNKKVNVAFKNQLKLVVKGYVTKPSEEALKKVFSVLDKATKRKLFHKNKTDRLKSQYTKLLGAKTEEVKTAKKTIKKTKTAKKRMP